MISTPCAERGHVMLAIQGSLAGLGASLGGALLADPGLDCTIKMPRSPGVVGGPGRGGGARARKGGGSGKGRGQGPGPGRGRKLPGRGGKGPGPEGKRGMFTATAYGKVAR